MSMGGLLGDRLPGEELQLDVPVLPPPLGDMGGVLSDKFPTGCEKWLGEEVAMSSRAPEEEVTEVSAMPPTTPLVLAVGAGDFTLTKPVRTTPTLPAGADEEEDVRTCPTRAGAPVALARAAAELELLLFVKLFMRK